MGARKYPKIICQINLKDEKIRDEKVMKYVVYYSKT